MFLFPIWHTSIHLRVSLAQLELQRATRGLMMVQARGWRSRKQDGPALPAEWIHLSGAETRISAATRFLRLWKGDTDIQPNLKNLVGFIITLSPARLFDRKKIKEHQITQRLLRQKSPSRFCPCKHKGLTGSIAEVHSGITKKHLNKPSENTILLFLMCSVTPTRLRSSSEAQWLQGFLQLFNLCPQPLSFIW